MPDRDAAPEAAAEAPRKARWSAEKKQAHKAAPKTAPRAEGKSVGFKTHGGAARHDRPARGDGAEARPRRAAGFKSHKPATGGSGKGGDRPFRAGPKPGKR